MGHFARIDENNIVTEIAVIANDSFTNEDGDEVESTGIGFLNYLYGKSVWVQTSYNNNFRKQFASIGFTYDSTKNKFIAPQPFDSWSLDDKDDWIAPIPCPTDKTSIGNEENQTWDSI